MVRQVEKTLERIKKMVEKQQFPKALLVAEEALGQHPKELDLIRYEILAAVMVRDWTDILRRLKRVLQHHRLGEVLDYEARGRFLQLLRESAPFRGGLIDHILNTQGFENLFDMLEAAQEGDQRWLVGTWVKVADELEDSSHGAVWLIASGVGHLVLKEYEMALDYFSRALSKDNRYLKKIMTICQNAGGLDVTHLTNRLRLIRLVISAGKKEESLSLLHALGLESKENALQIIIELPNLMAEHLEAKDVCLLRFHLAVFLEDQELMSKAVNLASHLSTEDLFPFQKHALAAISRGDLRRKTLLGIAKLYAENNDWEDAALLAETMFSEEQHVEVIAFVEHILEHYPILTKLHLMVADYHIRHENLDKGLEHLTLIKQVPELMGKIQDLMEAFLARGFEERVAHFLFEILPPGSDRTSILALEIMTQNPFLGEKFHQQLNNKAPTDNLTPIWLLALIESRFQESKYNSTVELIEIALEQFPDCSHEFLSACERLAEHSDFGRERVNKVIEKHKDVLVPRNLWLMIIEEKVVSAEVQVDVPIPLEERPTEPHPIVQSKDFESDFGSDTDAFLSAAIESTHNTEISNPQQSLGPELDSVKAFVAAGEFEAAAQAAERCAEKYDEYTDIVLECLGQLSKEKPQPGLWDQARLNILIRAERFEEAAKIGNTLLKTELPDAMTARVNQLVGFACEGLGKPDHAINHFCEASKTRKYYERNRQLLVNQVFPDRQDYLQRVLQIVLDQQDQETWRRLLQKWEQHGAEIQELIEWQQRFNQVVQSSASAIDLAYWQSQAGLVEEALQSLRTIDLKDASIKQALFHVTDLIRLKEPNNVQCEFLVARFHLIQGEVNRACDTFRNLTRENPSSSQKVFQYLKKFLEKNSSKLGNVSVYGLLIRLALDLNQSMDAVSILAQLSHLEPEAAQSLCGGVYRMIKEQKEPQVLVKYLQLLHQWKDFEGILRLHEENEVGKELIEQRLDMLEQVAGDPKFADRAHLAQARLLWQDQQFEACHLTLSQIESPETMSEALETYLKLAQRFPDRLDIQKQAAWLSWHFGRVEDAVEGYKALLENGGGDEVWEAFAVLKEAGMQLDLKSLANSRGEDLNGALAKASNQYQRLREWALTRWLDHGGAVPIESLLWLVETRNPEFSSWYQKMKPFMQESERAIVETYALKAEGQTYYAAMRMSSGDHDPDLQRSIFLEAQLTEQALMAQNKIPPHLAQKFLAQVGKPKPIFARIPRNKVGMNVDSFLEVGGQDA